MAVTIKSFFEIFPKTYGTYESSEALFFSNASCCVTLPPSPPKPRTVFQTPPVVNENYDLPLFFADV